MRISSPPRSSYSSSLKKSMDRVDEGALEARVCGRPTRGHADVGAVALEHGLGLGQRLCRGATA